MGRVKVCTLMGTRPEAIKLGPVIRAFASSDEIEHELLITGQHRELLDQVLAVFGLVPAEDFRIMEPNQELSVVTGRVLAEVGQRFLMHRPDWLVVQGDTTSAFAGALAAFYQRIPIAHVEAGLRTNDMSNPFPEEANRRFIDTIASLHFAPTTLAASCLLKEGVDPASVYVTGNTGIDALLQVSETMPVERDSPNGRRLLLVTAHRRESFGQELRNICQALRDLVLRNDDVQVVYSVHPNPNVSGAVRTILEGTPWIDIIPPPVYPHFIALMKRSFLILTDSGGIQEEAPSLGKPVLVLRARTERQEAIEAGTAQLVGTSRETIVHETEKLLHDQELYTRMAQARNPYGDGHAAERIQQILLRVHSGQRGEAGQSRSAVAVCSGQLAAQQG